MRRLWDHLDAMRWKEAGELLANDAVIRYPDSGRVFGNRADFVSFNASYPGRSRCTVRRIIAGTAARRGHALVAAEVEVDNDERGRFWCAGFYRVDGGLIVDATEYWVGGNERRPDHTPAQRTEPDDLVGYQLGGLRVKVRRW